ncbi:MAG: prepilin-type N-terminal cleavage/methylation domain-containing protein [Armatimonadota bacterium]
MKRTRPAGFTLIELLVVIAIIAILAAILFPVFANARARSRTARCAAHQKELMQSVMMYMDDYKDRLPSYQYLSWRGDLPPLYFPYVKDHNITICSEKMAYAWNECLVDWPLASDFYANRQGGIPELQVHPPIYVLPPQSKGRPLSTVVSPAATPAFMCSFRHHVGPDGRARGYGWGADDAINPNRMLNNHQGGANYAFLDGHVQWYRPQNNKILMPTKGLDYDGDGTFGDETVMR